MVPYESSPEKNSTSEEKDQEKTPMKENAKRKTRKRKREPNRWKKNIRKEKIKKGEAHESIVKGKKQQIPGKQLKESCGKGCHFKCLFVFNQEKRSEIFKNFYTLSYKEKNGFILSNVIQYLTKQKRKADKSNEQRKTQAFKYYLPSNGEQIQICKKMFLNTLSISSKKV